MEMADYSFLIKTYVFEFTSYHDHVGPRLQSLQFQIYKKDAQLTTRLDVFAGIETLFERLGQQNALSHELPGMPIYLQMPLFGLTQIGSPSLPEMPYWLFHINPTRRSTPGFWPKPRRHCVHLRRRKPRLGRSPCVDSEIWV